MLLGMEIITIGILFLVIVVLSISQIFERRDHVKQISEMTSKLMSNSFSEFAIYNNGQRVSDKAKPAKRSVTDPVLGDTY